MSSWEYEPLPQIRRLTEKFLIAYPTGYVTTYWSIEDKMAAFTAELGYWDEGKEIRLSMVRDLYESAMDEYSVSTITAAFSYAGIFDEDTTEQKDDFEKQLNKIHEVTQIPRRVLLNTILESADLEYYPQTEEEFVRADAVMEEMYSSFTKE